MDICALSPSQLTTDDLGAWSTFQRDNPLLASPYFCPEFTLAVDAVRNDVEVAVMREADKPVGFLPYQRTMWNRGRPVGGRLSDFQAMIAMPGLQFDPLQLVQACGLSSWSFDHLLTSQESFAPFVWREADSPYIDLTDGFDVYMARRHNGRSLLSEYGQRRRKLTREVGPLRFEAHVSDPAILAKCIEWKAQQYRRTKLPNLFAFRWVLELFDKLLTVRSDAFSAMVSVLYAGDRIASINISLRSRNVLHAWFPSYDVELAHYSPGTLLWFETMQAANSIGIQRIDLGKGPEKFKRRFQSGATSVAEGTVDLQPATALLRRAWHKTRDLIRSSPLSVPARAPAQLIYRCRSWLEYH